MVEHTSCTITRRENMTEIQERKPHGIMISNPYQGHINPYVNLALKLASEGFTITFVHFEHVHHNLAKVCGRSASEVDFFSEARESGLDIRYKTMSDRFPLEFDRNLYFDEYTERIHVELPDLAGELVREMIESDPFSAYFLVTDTIYSWPAIIASKYGLPNISFWTELARVFSLVYHRDLLQENGHFPCRDEAEEEITYVPGIVSINTRDLMPVLKESESSSVIAKIVFKGFDEVKKADFILHNTVQELEAETLSALNKYQPNYAIGPTNFFGNITAVKSVRHSLWSTSDCSNWLNSKPPGTVLYVSFGSFVHSSKQLIDDIAYGLLLSEVPFIWILRPSILSNGDTCVLPDEYEEKIKDRGLIIPWCDQIMVLSNPAVGGFLTHNGWNSTVESMWCGVPMICYPFAFDQITNRNLVVDYRKIGINLCDGKLLDPKEVAEKLNGFFTGTASKTLRQNASAVKEIIQRALGTGGSSQRNFDQFIEDLMKKIHDKACWGCILRS